MNTKKKLFELMSIQSESFETTAMREYIKSYLDKVDGVTYYEKDENIYATKGTSDVYPCVVAHTDTVHDIIDNYEVFSSKVKSGYEIMFALDTSTMQRAGIGGDDKVGIFACLQAIERLEYVKVAFFRDEEVGCQGSEDADMSFFDDVGMVLQADRKGYEDFVREIYGLELFTKEFSEAIAEPLSRFQKKETRLGGLTDVYQLRDNGLEVCVANLSCGYYNPHTANEYIIVEDVLDTVELMIELCAVHGDKVWECKNTFAKGKKDRYSRYNSWGSYDTFEADGVLWKYDWEKGDYVEVQSYSKKNESLDDESIGAGKTCCGCGACDTDYDDTMGLWFCYECNDYIYDDISDDGFNDSPLGI